MKSESAIVAQKANAVFLGNVGLGKTHLATALGYAACQEGYTVRFANAISVINDLSAAQKRGLLKKQLKNYLLRELLILDELGYLPSTSTAPIFSFKSSVSVTSRVCIIMRPPGEEVSIDSVRLRKPAPD